MQSTGWGEIKLCHCSTVQPTIYGVHPRKGAVACRFLTSPELNQNFCHQTGKLCTWEIIFTVFEFPARTLETSAPWVLKFNYKSFIWVTPCCSFSTGLHPTTGPTFIAIIRIYRLGTYVYTFGVIFFGEGHITSKRTMKMKPQSWERSLVEARRKKDLPWGKDRNHKKATGFKMGCLNIEFCMLCQTAPFKLRNSFFSIFLQINHDMHLL